MKRKVVVPCLVFLTIFFLGCFMEAGTHGSIKGYSYSCRKDVLENAIMTVIKDNPNIYRDTSLDYLGSSPLVDSTGFYNSTAGDNYYNDIKHYVTIKITSGQGVNEYIFRYYGSDESWSTSMTSQVFICYAYDKDRNGGSEGNGGLNRRTENLKQELTSVFEKELIQKVDEYLNIVHKETD